MSVIERILAVVVLTGITIGFTALILKLFPSLKRLNWKVVFGAYFILKLFDFHSTYLCFAKYKIYDAELNVFFSLFYKMGFGMMLSFILAGIIAILIGFFIIKILISKKSNLYFIPFFLLVAVLIAVINNYLGYFFFGKL